VFIPIRPLICRIPNLLKRWFHLRIHRPELIPEEDNERSGDHFRATGKDPQFDLRFPVERPLQSGWVMLRYRGEVVSDDAIFVPKIYPDTGVLYGESAVIHLRPHYAGEAVHLFKLNESLLRCRFDPFDMDYPKTITPYEGEYRLTDFKIIEMGPVILFLYALVVRLKSIWGKLKGDSKRLCEEDKVMFEEDGWVDSVIGRTYSWLHPLETLDYWHDCFKEVRVKSAPHGLTGLKVVYVVDLNHSPINRIVITLYSLLRQRGDGWFVEIKSGGLLILILSKCIFFFRGITVSKYTNQKDTLQNNEGDKLVYYAPLIGGDSLAPQATEQLITAIDRENPDLIYADSIIRDLNSRSIVSVETQSAFSIDGFFANPRMGRFMVFSDRLYVNKIDQLDGYGPPDLLLEVLPDLGLITHIPQLLLQANPGSKSRLSDQQRVELIESFLKTKGFEKSCVRLTPTDGLFSIRYNNLVEPQKVLIIIPTKNGHALLKRAVESLKKTVPPHLYHLVIVDHESDDPELLSYLDELNSNATILRFRGEFNYSKINNFAVSECTNDYDFILFLNNDIEAIDSGWFESMIDKMGRKEVGVVGATLLYPDKTIQHAGVVLGCLIAEGCLIADHMYKKSDYLNRYLTKWIEGDNYPLIKTTEYSAVTAACMMVRRASFERVGGFDENLAVGFGDIDLCLRVKQRGGITLLDAEAVLIHHESKSRVIGRKGDPHPDDTTLFRERYKALLGVSDPWHHPLLTKDIYYYRLKRGVRENIFDDSPGFRTVDLSAYLQI